MAHACELKLTIDDFQHWAECTPLLADLKPSGKYVMEDLQAIGGVPAVMKMMLNRGVLKGDCITVTGETLRENLKSVKPVDLVDQPIIKGWDNPIQKDGHLQVGFYIFIAIFLFFPCAHRWMQIF
jgi:dihydroxy-acid dehydratase